MGLAGYENIIAGMSSGLAKTFVCHPLDLLRIRYSVNDNNVALHRPQYSSYFHAAKCIFKAKGITGFYQGLSPNIISTPIAYGLYFHLYHKIHPHFDRLSNISPLLQNFVVGFVTGAPVHVIANPLSVARVRLCLQYENEATKKYRGMVHCLRKILRDEGIRGWYKGFMPGLWSYVNVSSQFAIYNFLKDWRCKSKGLPHDSKLGTMDYLTFSYISSIVSTISLYPFQVLKARLQDHHTDYKSSKEVIYQILKREGVLGFYKGMAMATLIQLPSGIVTLVVYEHVKRLAKKFSQNHQSLVYSTLT